MRSAPTVRPTIKRESLARWRTFALSAPSRCSWSSSGALPTSPQAPSTPERWLERQPPMWLRRISRNSPRIVTSWWKPATRWPRSIALNPPRPALVDWCPCRKFQCQHYFPCDFSYLSSFFFYIYISLSRDRGKGHYARSKIWNWIDPLLSLIGSKNKGGKMQSVLKRDREIYTV